MRPWPRRGEPSVHPQHLGLAKAVPVVLGPQRTGVVARGVLGVDDGGDNDRATSASPSLIEVGILDRSGREGAEPPELKEVRSREGAQINRVDLLTAIGMVEACRTHCQRTVHGGGHRSSEAVGAHRIHPSSCGGAGLEHGLHRPRHVVGCVAGVGVGAHQQIGVRDGTGLVQAEGLNPALVVNDPQARIHSLPILEPIQGAIGRSSVGDDDVERPPIVLFEQRSDRVVDRVDLVEYRKDDRRWRMVHGGRRVLAGWTTGMVPWHGLATLGHERRLASAGAMSIENPGRAVIALHSIADTVLCSAERLPR